VLNRLQRLIFDISVISIALIHFRMPWGLGLIGDVLDSVPGVGYVTSAIQSACGDKEAAERSLQMANRTSKVLAAGATGALVGGPIGAVAAGAGTLVAVTEKDKK
jgi:hypothetical protein